MTREVEFTDEFSRWWDSLTENQQDDVAYSVGLPTELGPALGFPHSSKLIGSRHSGMRELRTQSSGRPLRTLYAFDPLRVAILLIGGDKTGSDRWYEAFIALADRIYDEHLRELRKRGERVMPERNFRDSFNAIQISEKETIHPSCRLETFVNCLTRCRPSAGAG